MKMSTCSSLEEEEKVDNSPKKEVIKDEYGCEAFGQLDFGDIQGKPPKDKLVTIPGSIRNGVGSAIRDFDMIKEGDKILIAISGGKDSLSLIHILKHF